MGALNEIRIIDHNHRSKLVKITKSQLKRIIKEELQNVLREGGAFASDEEIQDIVDVASEVDPDIQEFSEFYEAARIAWNEGRLKSR